MPSRPARPCAQPGCRQLVTPPARYCASDARAVEQRRGSASSRGYDGDWRKLRAWFVARHPLCEDCLIEGRTQATEEVDHVTPITRGGERLDPSNLRALCKSHHSQKTARENSLGSR